MRVTQYIILYLLFDDNDFLSAFLSLFIRPKLDLKSDPHSDLNLITSLGLDADLNMKAQLAGLDLDQKPMTLLLLFGSEFDMIQPGTEPPPSLGLLRQCNLFSKTLFPNFGVLMIHKSNIIF